MLKLRPDQLRRLRQQMLASFPTRADFGAFVLLTTGDTLDTISANPLNLDDDILRVIVHAQSNRWLADLLAALVSARPTNPEFQAIQLELIPPGAPPPADPWLTCIVRNAPFIDREPLREAMRELEADGGRQVLVVHGDRGTGKTYTAEFVRWRARECSHEFIHVDLEQLTRLSPIDSLVWPEAIAASLSDQMGLGLVLPTREQADQQYSRWNLVCCDKLTGALIADPRRWWIVVDSFNLVPLPQATSDFFKELAFRVDASLSRVRLVLLGFGDSLRPDLERHAHRERTTYPTHEDLGLYFQRLHVSAGKVPDPATVAAQVQRVLSGVDPNGPARMRSLADAVGIEMRRVLTGD